MCKISKTLIMFQIIKIGLEGDIEVDFQLLYCNFKSL